jgi:glyoxylase-like metal-dependent hydrolase (beta-lactamase superfamily II)
VAAADEVCPGVWRIALDLPWPGAAPANAWALAAGDGIVLVDTGLHAEGSLEALSAGLAAAGSALTDIRLLICTHAHGDHVGQAATVCEAAGCELWLHADHRHGFAPLGDIEAEIARRQATGRRCGVPEDALDAYAAAIRGQDLGVAAIPRVHGLLADGVEIAADSGRWQVIETAGHAPSHVCLFEPQAGLLISGDHLLQRPSIAFEHGWTPDPVGDLLRSIDRTDALGAQRCLPGHGEAFDDVSASVAATRAGVRQRREAVAGALAGGASTPLEIAERAYAAIVGEDGAGWMFAETLCLLEHLELRGEVRLAEALRWQPADAD